MAKKKKEEPEVEEFMEIGGSPVPGITLRHVLRGHTDVINRIAWSPDGRYIATPSADKTIRIWDIDQKECKVVLNDISEINDVAWSPDSQMLASGSENGEIHIWQVWKKEIVAELGRNEKTTRVRSIAWSPEGNLLAVGYQDKIDIWEIGTKQQIQSLSGLSLTIPSLSWSPSGRKLAASTAWKVQTWDRNNWNQIKKFEVPHKDESDEALTGFYTVEWSHNEKYLAVGSTKNTIHILHADDLKEVLSIEGHTGSVFRVSFSYDDRFLASKSVDKTVRIWDTDTWNEIAIIKESTTNEPIYDRGDIVFHPNSNFLVTLGENSTAIRMWELNFSTLVTKLASAVRYTTAKLVLVGDSGVGKTGLGWRLAHNEFKEHSSTHGQQFWVVPELKKTREDGTECEAVLWDLAGQPDYRLVHSLYLDDVDTAMVLFDPSNRQEPLAGVDFWLNQLKDKDKKLRNSILVGARTDRGTSTLTDAELQAFCERNGISGGYIPTSATNGDGLPELMEKLKEQIPWDQMTTTVTTVTFKKIKEFVLSLKEKTRRRKVLLQPFELRKQLEKTDRKWKFTDAEMMTAVGHLENHGYVKVVHGSNGAHSILLSPDLLVNLASSIILEARRNPRGLGVLEESLLLRGEYPFPELTKLHEEERKILLDVAAVLFIEHNLCFRETFNQQTFLVFPSLINEKRPLDESGKIIEGETYQVKGAVENLYASMVVLLGYTNTFVRTHQWQNQAQYEMGIGEVCGFQQVGYPDGSIELVLNYGEKTPDPVRLMFRGLFERFLSRRELEIARYQSVTCQKCGASLARNVVKDQLNKGKNISFCHECGEKVLLPSPEPLTRLSPKQEVELDAQQVIAKYRTAFEAALVRVKGLLRDQETEKKPTCFISYAWGVSENERWVLQLAKDLRNADIDVLFDRWHNPPGTSLTRFTDNILSSDFVVVVGTPKLREKYEIQSQDPIVAAELRLINTRLRKPSKYGATVIPALLAGDFETSFTPLIQDIASIDFRREEQHFGNLFNLIWRLYELPFDNPLLEELQASMTPQQM